MRFEFPLEPGPVRLIGTSLTALAALALISGCTAPSYSDLDRRTGCDVIAAEHITSETPVVLEVHANCPAPNAASSGRADSVAQQVWQSIERPVDVLEVFVPAWATPPVEYGRSELSERFGPGPSGVVWPVRDGNPGETIWWLLPSAYLAAALTTAVIVLRVRRRGLLIILVRR